MFELLLEIYIVVSYADYELLSSETSPCHLHTQTPALSFAPRHLFLIIKLEIVQSLHK